MPKDSLQRISVFSVVFLYLVSRAAHLRHLLVDGDGETLLDPVSVFVPNPDAKLGRRVEVRPLVEFGLLDETHRDEVVEVGVEATVVDILAVVVLKLALDAQPVTRLVDDDFETAVLELREVRPGDVATPVGDEAVTTIDTADVVEVDFVAADVPVNRRFGAVPLFGERGDMTVVAFESLAQEFLGVPRPTVDVWPELSFCARNVGGLNISGF